MPDPSSLSAIQHLEDLVDLMTKKLGESNALIEITQAINRNESEQTIFRIFENVMKSYLKVDLFRLYMFSDNQWSVPATHGMQPLAQERQSNLCAKLMQFREIVNLENSTDDELAEYSVVVPVLHSEDQFVYFLLGDPSIPDHLDSESSLIPTILNLIMRDIEKRLLFRQRLVQERLQKEIDLAGQVQSMLFPRELPNNSKIDIDAVYLPHHSIGGDYYDYIEISEHEFLFCIADVTGKGISAALLMSNFQANLRALIRQGHSLTSLVTELNSILFASTKGERFITLFVGLLDTRNCTMQYVNAGHHSPFVIKDSSTRMLESGTTVIGVFDELPFLNPGVITLEPGSLIFCYTDGLVELEEDSYTLDIDGLRLFVEQNSHLKPAEINRELITQMKLKTGRTLFDDDITLLTFRCS